MEIILIAAMTADRVIGKDNDIPWHIPGEQTRFKEITWGHSMIMGRKTYESIGRALPGRRNIVISRNPTFQAPDCEIFTSQEDALAACEGEEKVFVIGGEQLFRRGLQVADTLILTIIDLDVAGDTWFPEFSEKEFLLVWSEHVRGKISYKINKYKRRG